MSAPVTFQHRADGRVRLVYQADVPERHVDDGRTTGGRVEGQWTSYTSPATVAVDGAVYLAFGRYFDGLPGITPEVVYRLVTVSMAVEEVTAAGSTEGLVCPAHDGGACVLP